MCCCVLFCVVGVVVVRVGGVVVGLDHPPPDPLCRTPFRRTAQNFALFFPSLATVFILFSLSYWSFSLNFGGCHTTDQGPCKWARLSALGLSCETPAAAATKVPRKRPTREGKHNKKLWWEREKKARNFGLSTRSGPPPLRGPHLFWAHPPLGARHPSGPHNFGPTMTHTRSQNRLTKIGLAKIVIGQNWIGPNWLWPKLAGPKPRWQKMDWPKMDWPKLVKSGWPKRDWPKSVPSVMRWIRISDYESKRSCRVVSCRVAFS